MLGVSFRVGVKIDTGGEVIFVWLLGCLRHEPTEGRGASRSERRSQEPALHAEQIECGRGEQVLQVGFGLPSIPRPAQSTASERLGMGGFHACARGISHGERWGLFTLPRRAQGEFFVVRMQG